MSLIVVDLDGTLANCSHRECWLPDWEKFFSLMGGDAVNRWCLELMERFRDDEVVIMTGRPERFRGVTEEWLRVNGVGYDRLVMRPDDDFSVDWELKERLGRDLDILFVLEDNPGVVEMWRRRGVACLSPGHSERMASGLYCKS